MILPASAGQSFRELEYQDRALKALGAYLDALKPEKAIFDEAAELPASKPHLKIPLPHFPAYANDPKAAEEIIKAVNGPPVVIKLLEGTQGIGEEMTRFCRETIFAWHRRSDAAILPFVDHRCCIIASDGG